MAARLAFTRLASRTGLCIAYCLRRTFHATLRLRRDLTSAHGYHLPLPFSLQTNRDKRAYCYRKRSTPAPDHSFLFTYTEHFLPRASRWRLITSNSLPPRLRSPRSLLPPCVYTHASIYMFEFTTWFVDVYKWRRLDAVARLHKTMTLDAVGCDMPPASHSYLLCLVPVGLTLATPV